MRPWQDGAKESMRAASQGAGLADPEDKRFEGLLVQLRVTFYDLSRGLDVEKREGESGGLCVCGCRMCVSRTPC